ncbi:hypothetical protein [Hymenobacter coccineus]|uniref:hypothetical protein n=1 Tax=Hymenobacter coccineus TaxID=1908235 RepID=UPI000F7AC6C5|nr:hypothetical protein [Hymenobacter coccineus]
MDHLVALSEFALQFAAHAQPWQASLTAWRRAYRRALPSRRARMQAAYDPREATALLAALYRLYDESFGDMQQIVAFGHTTFQPPAA